MKSELQKLLILYKVGKITKQQFLEGIAYIKMKVIKQSNNNNTSIVKHTPEKPNKSENKVTNPIVTNPIVTNPILSIHPMLVQHKIYQYNVKLYNKHKSNLKKEITNEFKNEELYTDNIHDEEESAARFAYHQSILNDDKAVRVEQAKYIQTLCGLNSTEKLIKLSRSKVIKEFKAEHNYSKKVVLLEGFVVRKTVDQTSFGNFVFWNEIKSLMKLFPYNHFPKLVAYDPNSLVIYMSYCGDMLNCKNLPINWREQLQKIKQILVKSDVNSNDMLLRNTCVMDNRINIIDFGLNTQFKKDINITMGHFYEKILNLESKKHK